MKMPTEILLGLAYMGKGAGYILAQQERKEYGLDPAVFDLLGKIRLYAESDTGDWILIDEIGETGPIAVDLIIIFIEILGSFIQAEKVNLKLVLNKGLWSYCDYYSAYFNCHWGGGDWYRVETKKLFGLSGSRVGGFPQICALSSGYTPKFAGLGITLKKINPDSPNPRLRFAV